MGKPAGTIVLVALALSAPALSARTARGQFYDLPPGEFAVGIGYAEVELGDSDFLPDSEGALRFDSSLSISPFPALPQLRLGGALGFTMVLDSTERVVAVDGGVVFVSSSDVPLFLFEPEFRVSWQQPLGENGFYIEPGIGVGWVIANLSIDDDDSPFGESVDESGSGFSTRAFVNVGFLLQGGVAGIQASYMWADDLDLGPGGGGEINEFYLGIFGALRF